MNKRHGFEPNAGHRTVVLGIENV